MEFVEHLLSDDLVLQKIILPRDSDSDADQDPSGDGQQSIPSSSIGEDDEEVSLKRTPDETPAVHVARYLKSVVVWFRACAVVKLLPCPIRAHRVLFPRPQVTREERQAHYTVIEKNILNHPRLLAQGANNNYAVELQTLHDNFLQLPRARSRKVSYTGLPVLHAEAALSALVHSSKGAKALVILPKGGQQVVDTVFQDATTRISVSQKCCWCCWKLGSILNASSNETLKIVLPGCHSTVFPWFPPPQLPLEVLQTMKDELTNLVVKKLVQNRTRALSNQSSMRSSGDSPPNPASEALDLKTNLEEEEQLMMENEKAEIDEI